MKQLLLYKSDPAQRDLAGPIPLHRAVHVDDVACIQLLSAAKVDVNSETCSGLTALHKAAETPEDTIFVETLLSYGASIESQDDAGFWPLRNAVSDNIPAHLQLFLGERCANLNAASTTGTTALMLGVLFNAHET